MLLQIESSTEYKLSHKETKQRFWLADQGLLSSPLQSNPLQQRNIPINSKHLSRGSFTYHKEEEGRDAINKALMELDKRCQFTAEFDKTSVVY